MWLVSSTEPPHPSGQATYDYEFISNLVGLLLKGERGWSRLYSELGVTPHTVLYEDLLTSDGYRASIVGILRHLELDDGIDISPPRTNRQADDMNEEWVHQFLAHGKAQNHPTLNVMIRRHVRAG